MIQRVSYAYDAVKNKTKIAMIAAMANLKYLRACNLWTAVRRSLFSAPDVGTAVYSCRFLVNSAAAESIACCSPIL